MQQVEAPMETIHLYVVRGDDRQPPQLHFVVLSLLLFLTLVWYGCFVASQQTEPAYETLKIPAFFLPPRSFSTSILITPTGIKTYPSRYAQGLLTLTNGSVISQELPKGLIFTGKDGTEVVTDDSVFVPAGSAMGYGFATVSAHAMIGGASGNIPANAIDRVEGSSIYIRNLSAFHGGENAYSIAVITPQDRQAALDIAKVSLTTQKAQMQAILAKPCNELVNGVVKLVVKWTCKFVAYPKVSGMKITAVRLVDKILFVDVLSVARPRIIWAK